MSIGNIVAGGVGKTPVVIKLAQELSKYGVPGIVLRGYRSAAEHGKKPVILSIGNGPQLPSAIVGDEAYLLSQNVPQAIVCVGKNKVHGAQIACELGADWILLDDGLQHRRLGRDIELIVVNAADPFGKGYFLPRGYLRDEINALKRADLILISENAGALSLEDEAKIQKISSAPMIKMRQEISAFLDWDGNFLGLNLKEKKVGIFCGIGDPKRFHQSLARLGAEIVGSLHFPDHLAEDGPKMRKFIKECKEKGAELILCTEKDRVKLSEMRDVEPAIPAKKNKEPSNGAKAYSPGEGSPVRGDAPLGKKELAGIADVELPLRWVKTTINITHGKEHWDRMIDQIRRKDEQ
jgi:tetraacyldisaccharide 4'-kinase